MNAAKNVTAIFNTGFSDFSLYAFPNNSIYATIIPNQPTQSSATTIKISPLYGFSSLITLSVLSVNPSLPVGSTFCFWKLIPGCSSS